MEISIAQIIEMCETSAMSIRDIVWSFFLDDKTIVHCIDNNTDYRSTEVDSLIKYVENRINNK